MYELELVKDAGLTDGEAKVYIALLELGSSTTGPIIMKSGVARSFIPHILKKLIEKGLASYITQKKVKYYRASEPARILDEIEKRRQNLEQSKEKISKLLPQLSMLRQANPATDIQVYEGFRGLQTAFEHYHTRVKKGGEILSLGIYAFQEEKYHDYWKEDHEKRVKEGIRCRMLFNKGTDKNILKNRNSYKYCDSRYMASDVKTPSWIFIYNDVSQIFLQDKKQPVVVEIINKQIAETFRSYFNDYWSKTKPFQDDTTKDTKGKSG
ncbi:MAG TPA: helix-turn-helix domain-containing protein [Candidatus Nanoarchaeia archaeon]|nr:helix-turn-helix domain-containing protein [Candidatus Nanoarchaeia archaeon]